MAKAEATKNPSDPVEISSLMEEYCLPQEIEPKINIIIAKRVDQKIQPMLENGSLTSGRGGTGMTVNPNRDSTNGYPTVTPTELQPVTLAH